MSTSGKRRGGNPLQRRAFALAADVAGRSGAYELLHDMAAVESLTALSDSQWRRLIQQLQARLASRRSHDSDCPPNVTAKQWRRIQWLRRKIGMDDDQLLGFVRHVCKLEAVEWLDAASARRLLAGLSAVYNRQAAAK